MAAGRANLTSVDATLAMTRRPIDTASLASTLVRYPAMTAHVVGGIYWQALRLWAKRVPVHSHPRRDAAPEVKA
jgi:DUF1365 family protein